MKVTELRSLMKNADREQLEKAFAECYKALKKGQKEEMDPVLLAVLQGKILVKAQREKTVDFQNLSQQIVAFLENAYAGNYFEPNRVIPKSERPKWRFKVKNFIKELDKIPTDDPNYLQGVMLLLDIYRLLCDACLQYHFSTDDAFASIGWEQDKLFDMVVRKVLARGYWGNEISDLLELAISPGLSRESLQVLQELVLICHLKTKEAMEIAETSAHKLINKKKSEGKEGKGGYNQDYYIRDAINELCGFLLMLAARQGKLEQELEFYFTNVKEATKEIVLYCALDRMRYLDDWEKWIKVYEYGISRNIKPRDSLKEQYELERNHRFG